MTSAPPSATARSTKLIRCDHGGAELRHVLAQRLVPDGCEHAGPRDGRNLDRGGSDPAVRTVDDEKLSRPEPGL